MHRLLLIVAFAMAAGGSATMVVAVSDLLPDQPPPVRPIEIRPPAATSTSAVRTTIPTAPATTAASTAPLAEVDDDG
jgi:hypothetical protein